MSKLINPLVFLITAMLSISGCGTTNSTATNSAASKPGVKAPANIRDSFAYSARLAGSANWVDLEETAPVEGGANDGEPLVSIDQDQGMKISAAALDKEFLLRASLVYQIPSKEFNGLKSRVVAFSKKGSELFLLEASKGHVVDEDADTSIVLAKFNIIDERDGNIYFDFNSGFSQLFTAYEWNTQDFEGSYYRATYMAMPIRNSYIDSVSINDSDNSISVRQIAQMDASTLSWGSLTKNLMSVQVQYFLSPYNPNPNFKPYRQTRRDYRNEAFFEVAPQIDSALDTTVVYATKFQVDGAGSIKAGISSNTPAEFVEAVKDGILYWNRAFGFDAIQVEVAPEGVSAPTTQYDLFLQWVDYETAGFAYADAQADPRTGEALNAQIYMSSFWGILGRSEAIAALRTLSDLESKEVAELRHFKENLKDHDHSHGRPEHPSIARAPGISLKGFESRGLCHRETTAQFVKSLGKLVVDEATDEIIKKASQDAIREVVAHEVGHTIGLRHNFAGSLAANYGVERRQELMKSYIDGETLPADISASSSVMDYLPFEEQVIVGNHVGDHDRRALSYDEQAVQKLYFGKIADPESKALFCTDSEIGFAGFMFWGGYVDCMTFDYGNSYYDYLVDVRNHALELIPYALFARFVNAKAPDFGDSTTPVASVVLAPQGTAIYTQFYNWDLTSSVTENGAHFLPIRRKYSVETGIEAELIQDEEEGFIAAEIERLGGLRKALEIITPENIRAAHDKFIELTKDEEFTQGQNARGAEYRFTKAELKTMRERAATYFNQLIQEMARYDIILLEMGLADSLSDQDFNYGFYDVIADRVNQYVFSTDEEGGIVTSLRVPDEEADGEEEVSEDTRKVSELTVAELDKAVQESFRRAQANKQLEEDGGKPMKEIRLALPSFSYDFEIRRAAAALLSGVSSEASDWGVDEADEYRFYTKFKDLLETAFGGEDMASYEARDLPRGAIRRWHQENSNIFSMFNATPAEMEEELEQ